MQYLNYFLQALVTLAGLFLSWRELRISLRSGKWLRFALVVLIPLVTSCSIYLTFRSDSTLNSELTSTEKSLSDLKNYNYISTLTYNGANTEYFPASDPNHPMIPSGLPTILIGTYQITTSADSGETTGVEYKCDQQSQQKYIQAIVSNPDYPFSYYALATCEKQDHNPKWQQDAEKALEIFQITTTIDGHSVWQDAGLEETQALLK